MLTLVQYPDTFIIIINEMEEGEEALFSSPHPGKFPPVSLFSSQLMNQGGGVDERKLPNVRTASVCCLR